MTRVLFLTAAAGLGLAVACYSIVSAAGPWDWSWGEGGPAVTGDGPEVTRQLTWTGGERLGVAIPGTVAYTQGPQTAITVTGPKGAVDRVVVEDGALRFDRRVIHPGRLRVTMAAPDVREFSLAGSSHLTVANYDHERLQMHLAGSGAATAHGRAGQVETHIAGSGDVDLSDVATEAAEAHIAGSGHATLSPKARAEIHIAGSGDVVLTTRPAKVETHIVGSGRVTQGAAG